MFKKLFTAGRIGELTLENRMIVTSISTLTATDEGYATEQLMAYLERKAQGGWAMIITEYYAIAPHVGFFPRALGIWNDDLIKNHSELTRRVHSAGAKIAAQISHAGREIYRDHPRENAVSSSALKDVYGEFRPREITLPEIKKIVSQYGDTAKNLKKANFDAVEIYAAHGFLISNFLSKYTNHRTDEYGGSLRDRMRFLEEIVKDVRSKVGADFPVLVRLSTKEFVPGGLSLAETRVIVKRMEELGIDAINCSQGIVTVSNNIVEPFQVGNAPFVDIAEEIKKIVSIPVITTGRINDADLAETTLLAGKSDFIGMARASLADPDLPKKVLAGRWDEIRHCIGCNQGCIGNNMRGEVCRCMVNPEINREYLLDLNPAVEKKNITIIGGGIAGCEAAIAAARKGHNVTLHEKSDRLGGTWLIASLPLSKGELVSLVKWQISEMKRLNIHLCVNSSPTVEEIVASCPDKVIIATGSQPILPPIKGIESKIVVQANKILTQDAPFGENVVVIGGGSVGVETAEYMAFCGSSITLVEMRNEILPGLERETKIGLKEAIRHYRMNVIKSAKVVGIGEDHVIIEKNGKQITLDEVDTLVVAAGSRSINLLETPLREAGLLTQVIGDAKQVRNGLAAMHEGYLAGYGV
ncbi:FAD-dependent oxidoreductase [Serratia quinivorans]|uniref:FAD-dependent oxidoreductase n=1 Tax=Serratia quinivorans TaxID=137545 RepID=UPI0021796AC3|nr:FAD-dependent oxidoreductase [Serratia quinivorans]CAI1115314.1 NADH oxidase [Serratia quinivorans]CAI1876738.1 NADH oxidase [Serratia quinivorans]